MDRRNKKTEAAFTSALFHFLEKKELNKITVKELCEYADMNRGTFYLHYLDIYDLMEKTERNMIDAIFTAPPDDLHTDGESVISTFRYVREHKTEYRVMLKSDSGFMNKLRDYMADSTAKRLKKLVPGCTDALAQITSTIYMGGATALLEYWLTKDDCRTDPAELFSSLDHITKYIHENRM
ncbi:MAG: TetR/AcrR family transcriptional regulator [Clostridia bacterium]|nr:TetR/AcrR family transcriptional regulator [Clostridia bacterium]